jgi:hypothetical protein
MEFRGPWSQTGKATKVIFRDDVTKYALKEQQKIPETKEESKQRAQRETEIIDLRVLSYY